MGDNVYILGIGMIKFGKYLEKGVKELTGEALDLVLKDVPDDACRIVLAHNPDSADTDYTARVDLMISGHTHGGQVKIPFIGTPILPVKNKAYSSGFVRSHKTNVFISRGVGWAAIPLRFNCFPEIAILNIVRSEEQAESSL